MSPTACLAAVDGALSGLEHLHSLGIAHGGLLPSRVLLDRTGESRLAGAGLGSVGGAGDAPMFLSPDDLSDHPPSVASDLFAVGSLIFALSTGSAPFSELRPGAPVAARQRVAVPAPGLSPNLLGLIDAALDPDPAARPRSAAEMRDQLTEIAKSSVGAGWRTAGKAALAATAAAGVGTGAALLAGGAIGSSAAAAGSATAGGTAAGSATAAGTAAGSATAAGTAAGAGTAGSTGATGIFAAVAAKPVVAGIAAVGVAAGGAGTYAATRGSAPPPVPSTGYAVTWMGSGSGSGKLETAPRLVDPGTFGGQQLIAVAAGGANGTGGEISPFACAINTGGRAYCWGAGGAGQLGNGKLASIATPVPVATSGVLAGKSLVQISAGYARACALDTAGSAYCWGGAAADSNVPLGDGSDSGSATPVAVNASGALAGIRLTQVSVGRGANTCALSSAGLAYCWGYGADSSHPDSTPRPVDTSGALAGKKLVSISVGVSQACAVDAGGAAYCWAFNFDSTPTALEPRGAISGKLVSISVGDNGTACVLDDAGALYCWGNRELIGVDAGATGVAPDSLSPPLGDARYQPTPVKITGPLAGKRILAASVGSWAICAVDDQGVAYCWGADDNGNTSAGQRLEGNRQPTPLGLAGLPAGSQVRAVSCGGTQSVALVATPGGESPPAPPHAL